MSSEPRFGVEDPRFNRAQNQEDQPAATPPTTSTFDAPPPQRGCFKTCFAGCLIGTVVLLILGAIAVYWFTKNWRGMSSAVVSAAIKQGIEATELPAQEKAEMAVQIDRVA